MVRLTIAVPITRRISLASRIAPTASMRSRWALSSASPANLTDRLRIVPSAAIRFASIRLGASLDLSHCMAGRMWLM
jgi:hypothetical protein